MSDDENQIVIPPSFLALYSNERGRLLEPLVRVRFRYELCEDLAQHLSAQAQAVHHDMGLPQEMVLQRMHQGLANDTSTLMGSEATWVVQRMAELAGWPVPAAQRFSM